MNIDGKSDSEFMWCYKCRTKGLAAEEEIAKLTDNCRYYAVEYVKQKKQITRLREALDEAQKQGYEIRTVLTKWHKEN